MKIKKYIKLIILIILMFLTFSHNVIAQTIYLKNGSSIDSGNTEVQNSEMGYNQYYNEHGISYDITSLNFNMDAKKISIKGWATIHSKNNWSGVYSTISIGIGTESAPPNTFYEVDSYDDKNFFGWHCDPDGTGPCQNWKKTAGENDGDLAYYESQKKCYRGSWELGGCLFRNVGFTTNISLNDTIASGVKYYLYIMVTATDTENLSNSALIARATTTSVSIPASGNNYLIYSTTQPKTSKIIKIGVDYDSCSITYNGNTTNCSTNQDTNIINNGYSITVGQSSNWLIRTVSNSVYPQKIDNNGRLCSENPSVTFNDNAVFYTQILYQRRTAGSQYTWSQYCSTSIYWPSQSVQKLYKITGSSVGRLNGDGYFLPSSYFRPNKTMYFTLKPVETCSPVVEKKDLKCENPETDFKIRFVDDKTDCYQSFSTDGASVKIKFTQYATMKIKLNKTYLKKGEGFTLSAEYVDKISWEVAHDSSFTYSTGLTNYQRKQAKKKLLEQINKWFTESELIKGSNAKFYIKYDNDDTRFQSETNTIKGTWSLDKNVNDYTFVDFNNIDKNKGSVTVKGTWQMYNAWSDLSNITAKGVSHIYKPIDKSISGTQFSNNGQIYYTDLDEPDNHLGIYGHLWNLSGLKYKDGTKKWDGTKASGPIWSVKYTCGIDCFQDFYCEGSGCGTNTSNTKYNGYKFKYREIDPAEPFPTKAGKSKINNNIRKTRKGIDENWISWANAIAKANSEITLREALDDYIVSKRLAKTYDTTPEYIIEISDDEVDRIQEYNKSHNYYTGVEYDSNQTKSRFLNSKVATGILKRNAAYTNKVGYCGNSRTKFRDYSIETKTYNTINDILNTNCFCLLTDINGNCIYNSDFKGAGKQ